VSKPKSCTARIRLSFEKKGVGLGMTNDSALPKSKSKHYESGTESISINESGSISDRIAQCVCVALKPPKTLTLRPTIPSDLDPNVRVRSGGKSNVFIEIESDDIPSLRANINSYLRLANASYKCIIEGSADQVQ
jgi:tRNA threonylcarbamoyladenosine modification (KEOPS) complex  Pcc1 subunit